MSGTLALCAPVLSAARAEDRREARDLRELGDFRDLHRGETIVVCGCGVSLAHLDRPERFITIGVNDVGRRFDPDYLVVLNSRHQFSADRFRYVETSRARAVFSQLRLDIPHPRLVTLRLGRRGGVEVDGASLPYTRNSPYVAVALAVHMGARRVGLIGVDFTDHHFFGATGRHGLHRELPQIDAEYGRLYEYCRARGVELVNLSAVSRLTSLPRMAPEELAQGAERPAPRIVSYATTPVAGVPTALSRCIAARTPSPCRTVWADRQYGNGVSFEGDVEYTRDPREAARLLEEADAVVLHNGKVAPAHARLLEGKGIVTLAHNYRWNVDASWVERGFPGLVVAQYQATLPEFAGWTPVPNPLPLWEPAYLPGERRGPVTIAYTPSGRHESYPETHRLYWHGKGYRTTLAALDRLAARHAVRLEVIRGRQVPHEEALAMKRRAHVVVDECVTGSYHRNSLEALAVGAVAVNGVGIRPAVAEVLRACTDADAGIPFVCTPLAGLEETLEQLVSLGAEALAERGAAGRRWMERHWDFAAQWERWWAPAVARALEHAGRPYPLRALPPRPPAVPAAADPLSPRPVPGTADPARIAAPRVARPLTPAPRAAPAVEPPRTASLADASAIVPHGGGGERLRNLGVVLGALRRAGVDDVVVVEMGAEPCAAEVAAAAGARHVFVAGAFHKARAMNVGVPFVRGSRFFWIDSDVLVGPELLRHAVADLDARRLDCLVPWTSVRYLDAEATAAVAAGVRDPMSVTPVNTYHTRAGGRGGVVLVRTEFVRRFGGMCEEFRGWGGEDNAWFLKASVLGRAAATNRGDQHAFHLYHPLSGGHGPQAAMAANPNYARNLALLHEVRRLTSRDTFLRRFPVPAHAPAPWSGVRRVAGDAAVIEEMRALWGGAVETSAAGAGADLVIEPSPGSGTTARETALRAAIALAAGSTSIAGAPVSGPAAPRGSPMASPAAPPASPVAEDAAAVNLADAPAGLHGPWPWPDDALDAVTAHDVIARLPDKVHTMDELWRVLRDGGTAVVSVLTTDGPGAFADPRAVSYWNRHSFEFVEEGHPARARHRCTARFRVEREATEPTGLGPRLTLTLRAVKPPTGDVP